MDPQTRAKIDAERRRLNHACALLASIAAAHDNDADVDFGDAALAVRDIVQSVVDALDTARLD
jgi:hypothetical protein